MSWGMYNYPYEFWGNLKEGGSCVKENGKQLLHMIWEERRRCGGRREEGRLEGEGREKKSGGEVGEEWGDIGEGRFKGGKEKLLRLKSKLFLEEPLTRNLASAKGMFL